MFGECGACATYQTREYKEQQKADRKKRKENAKAEASKRVEIIRRGVGKDE